MINWGSQHILRVAGETHYPTPPVSDASSLRDWNETHRKLIEPWLSAVFQSEHLSLLLGSGFTAAIALEVGSTAAGMGPVNFGCTYEDKLNEYARRKAAESGRGTANIEDQLSAALTLREGLLASGQNAVASEWDGAINRVLGEFLRSILETERAIHDGLATAYSGAAAGPRPHQTLIGFLMSFASRAASRERLHLFTTNYDRLVEFGCDLAGLRLVDRFTGTISPVFRSSRLQVDLHYNPPGIRGEPRLLEGVVQFTKLHGSLDWRRQERVLLRAPIAFGAPSSHPDLPPDPLRSVMIYPNAAKDIETAAYPYADLFRDFSSAVCRPNSVVVTYGYGFGDDHVNRVIADMLTIPSTHLIIISYGDGSADPHARARKFCEDSGRVQQISLLLGPQFSQIQNLAGYYLPKPAIDAHLMRMGLVLDRRSRPIHQSECIAEVPSTLEDMLL